ncbi:pentatricopeptide repeat-containing protein At2g20540-like [Aristolochia californica]|uniref:pentatricopeptide repeat-containing protein At2g20540-like n=1 Tax=Aristolochia californica TaxID=171875 RepID=UPI0035E0ACAB
MEMYTKCDVFEDAYVCFDRLARRDVVSWNTLIFACYKLGYSQNGLHSVALKVFHKMQVTGVKPNAVSGALEFGRWIHVYSGRHGLLKLAHEALHLFVNMEQARVKPNGITYLGFLSACAHAGFLSKGWLYFSSMTKDHSIAPGIEHYGCMLNRLGCSGCLDQALELINKMTIIPDATIWGSLLSACRKYGNIKIAITAMEHLIELEPEDTGNYILLSNTYVAAGMWDEVARMRILIWSKGMKKSPGCSLIELNSVVQEFVTGDDS